MFKNTDYSPVLKLDANLHGRDFVIGDLHGCFDLLERLLKQVRFDKTIDRLFSVGDLCDRGPDSLKCLQLLDESWFYAVLGNHEIMMHEFFHDYLTLGSISSLEDRRDSGFIENGGEWVKRYFQRWQKRMAPEFDLCLQRSLKSPVIITVGENKKRFNIVHAELLNPATSRNHLIVYTDADIDYWQKENNIPEELSHDLYWSRYLMLGYHRDIDPISPGLSTTYCGHTYGTTIRKGLSHVCLDTGACYSLSNYGESSHGLTMIDAQSGEWLWTSYQYPKIKTGNLAT